MMDTIIDQLQNGTPPDTASLRGWFSVALTKKLGVIRLPPAFWPADPKINPPAKHLFWAAVLLGDRDGIGVLEGILAAEDVHVQLPERIVQWADELLGFVSDVTLRAELSSRLRQVLPTARYGDSFSEPG